MMETGKYSYFDRDLSWLSFNERVLMEAGCPEVPLLERMKFLGIFSSNLDEFYRVRVPVLMALVKLKKKQPTTTEAPDRELLKKVWHTTFLQQQRFGELLEEDLLPRLEKEHIYFLYNRPVPEVIKERLTTYFLEEVLAHLQPVLLNENTAFFPFNNELYLLVELIRKGETETEKYMLTIPSAFLPRFYSVEEKGSRYVLFLDDVIRLHLPLLFREAVITHCSSFKITRDAELDLDDEYQGDLAQQIERQLHKRDNGLASRLLYSPSLPSNLLEMLVQKFQLRHANLMEGGNYHHLKDLMDFPIKDSRLAFLRWPPLISPLQDTRVSLLKAVSEKDALLHLPYHSFGVVQRFFNEASTDPSTSEIMVSLYRVAAQSKIAHALITAAKNGKQVWVLMELKARFDEANNLRWAKKMKEAGIHILYSDPGLKVHAKIALVKRKEGLRERYTALLATGNFNEQTAKSYTDHVLFTSRPDIVRELENVFLLLRTKKPLSLGRAAFFSSLLVSPFNLQKTFLSLIHEEMEEAKAGRPASIFIKLNNLEEKQLIDQLYAASGAGVKIRLLVRGICRLIPGLPGQSEHIQVKRIVDRYLEHGRVFVFHKRGAQKVWMGSADWMNRNIYRRIEVCFPLEENSLKTEILTLLDFQWQDEVKGTTINDELMNIPSVTTDQETGSQENTYRFLEEHEQTAETNEK